METYLDILLRLGVLWQYKPGDPHALLASGKHSNGFLNLSILTTHPDALRSFSNALIDEIADEIAGSEAGNPIIAQPSGHPDNVWVIGSAMGAIQIALHVAESFGYRAAYTEKSENGMSFDRFATEAKHAESIMLVEDVMTTGSTTEKTIQALAGAGILGKIKPFVGVFVNRSGKNEVDFGKFGKFKITSVIDVDFDVWKPEECPLCKEGSELLKPKHDWGRFTQK